MLDPSEWTPATIATEAPLLLVAVDTEEEFDWARPLARENTTTRSIAAQARAHRVFERFGIRPLYLVDWPVVSDAEASRFLAELFLDGRCEIGAHLHPWVTPPHEEIVNNRNSYAGNLPAALEREKLRRLTETIGDRFGTRPVVFRAGRYGVGPATAAILEELGYEIDTSVVPRSDFSDEDGPDFSHCGPHPYWFGRSRRLLEIPLTVGFTGHCRGAGQALRRRLESRPGRLLRLPGLFSRLGLFRRVRLSPEGLSHEEHRSLTEIMLAGGHRVFGFTYHSPSLAPGNTPYVRDARGLDAFLEKFERYFSYFVYEIGGRPASAGEILALARTA